LTYKPIFEIHQAVKSIFLSQQLGKNYSDDFRHVPVSSGHGRPGNDDDSAEKQDERIRESVGEKPISVYPSVPSTY
jgi:hypothetical protein